MRFTRKSKIYIYIYDTAISYPDYKIAYSVPDRTHPAPRLARPVRPRTCPSHFMLSPYRFFSGTRDEPLLLFPVHYFLFRFCRCFCRFFLTWEVGSTAAFFRFAGLFSLVEGGSTVTAVQTWFWRRTWNASSKLVFSMAKMSISHDIWLRFQVLLDSHRGDKLRYMRDMINMNLPFHQLLPLV